jgi:hypothetical protein
MEREIRERLADYLAGEVSLAAFEDWFVPAAWGLEEAEPWAATLASSILLALAERSQGHLDDSGLRRRLFQLLYTSHVGTPQAITASAAATQAAPRRVELSRSAVAGRRVAAAPG